MKIAEALLLRADTQKRLASLRERVCRCTAVQEHEAPPEDPAMLLSEIQKSCALYKALVFAINRANLDGLTSGGRSLTEALAERDALMVQHSILQATIASAARPQERYGPSEIRWVLTIDIPALQAFVDELAKQLRELNAEIQAANWQIEVEIG